MVGSRRFRLLIGIFIPILIFFLMSHNTAALKGAEYGYRYLNVLRWNYVQNGGTAVAQSATAYKSSLIRNISLNASSNNLSYITQPEFVVPSATPIPLRKNRQYHHTIIFFSEVDRPETTMTSVLCPRANNTFIDKCEIKELSRENYVQSITQYPDPNNVGNFVAGIGANANNIQMLEIWGHGRTDNDLSSLTYYNDWIFFIQNTSSTLDSPVRLTIYFSPIEVYADAESASDQAAEKEMEGTTNIENQTPQNTTGGTSENQQTTSIIGTISSFVGAFSNISPAQNCEMVLPFPDFVGGNQTVDICQGKDKAPAIITIASSLLLIVTFVPVAFIVLSMIYREIRSFTNG